MSQQRMSAAASCLLNGGGGGGAGGVCRALPLSCCLEGIEFNMFTLTRESEEGAM